MEPETRGDAGSRGGGEETTSWGHGALLQRLETDTRGSEQRTRPRQEECSTLNLTTRRIRVPETLKTLLF